MNIVKQENKDLTVLVKVTVGEADYKEQVDKFINLGLMQRTDTGFSLTKRGISLSNSVLCEFA